MCLRNNSFVLIVFSLVFHLGYAQTRPFPQNLKYTYGYKTTMITSSNAAADYIKWQYSFVKMLNDSEACVVKYEKDKPKIVSEGIGYGLLLVAYFGDKELFDKLLRYYDARKDIHGMMNWTYEPAETGNNNKFGATDADLDAAFALVVASKQWQADNRYKRDAKSIIDSLQKYNFVECKKVIVQKPGDNFGGCTCTNPSYYSPGYYRVFAKFEEENGNAEAGKFWNKAADDCYITLNKNAHPMTGLVYAWTNADGKNPQDCYYEVTGSGTFNSYQYDACRTPWRIAMDYVWFGTGAARDWLQKINRFVNAPIYRRVSDSGVAWYGAGGIQNIVDGYWQNGLRRIDTVGATYGHRHTIPFVGAFALAAMQDGQKNLDASMDEFNSIVPSQYYDTCLGALYKFLATGNFWNPYDGK